MISGSIVAIATPMHADGAVDYASLQRLVDWHIAEGTDAIVALGTIGRIKELLDLKLGENFALYSGDDATACESILLGCHGDISVTANVAPKLMHEMCKAAAAGDRKRALELDARLQPLHKHLF